LKGRETEAELLRETGPVPGHRKGTNGGYERGEP
jgi:hypothetical protein